MFSRRQLANAIRFLSMDAVQKANSGHPGAPMGMADIAEVLWRDFLKHSPNNPKWADRDRFVLSNGHSSMLLYSLLHLTGYDLPIEEIKRFRQLHSKTPGHPEYGCTPGVETTTGPLGQGIGNAVGMAIAEKTLAAQFNREGLSIVDHYTYVFLGDGCMMEGISHESCSLAGTMGLGKLIAFYDDNGISIDGEVTGWFTDDTAKRFDAYGWHVLSEIDGHDSSAISKAIEFARSEESKPTLIGLKTIIGFGSPNKAGSHDSHGSALGEEEVAETRKKLGWHYPPFEIPSEIYARWDAKDSGSKAETKWNQLFTAYQDKYPELANEFNRRISGHLPSDWGEFADHYIIELQKTQKKIATRQSSQKVLNIFGPKLPELLGGSADLAPSNLTIWSGSQSINRDDASGNYLHYGVREFGMSAIINGIAVHGGFLPYGATFLMFMEYARNAVRMAALMKSHGIFVYTHDSIGLGEDGPTHQAVEQISALRMTPNMNTWRPCDSVESAVAWRCAIERRDGPSALIFSRQGLEPQARDKQQLRDVARGGYILKDCIGIPDIIFIATGSEVALAVAAAGQLSSRENKAVRVVSMPCTERFDQQNNDYKESVLPESVRCRFAVEAGIADFWYKYVGFDGKVLGMNTFGESASASELFQEFGFTVENLLEQARELLL